MKTKLEAKKMQLIAQLEKQNEYLMQLKEQLIKTEKSILQLQGGIGTVIDLIKNEEIEEQKKEEQKLKELELQKNESDFNDKQ